MTGFGKDYGEEAENDFNLWRNAANQAVKKEAKPAPKPAPKTAESILVEGTILKGALFPQDMKERILDYKTRKSAEGGNFKFRLIDLFNKGGLELRKDMGVVIEEREYTLEMSLTDNPVPEGGTSTSLTAIDQTDYELRDIK